MHDSLLPAYAGFSPLIWALINGEKEVGVTAHMMDAELDAGDIVLQRSVPVGPRDTTTDLFHKTLDLFGPITVDESSTLIASGRTDWTPQDRSKASFFHKRSDRGQPHRLDLAGGGPGPAGPGAVRPLSRTPSPTTGAAHPRSSPRPSRRPATAAPPAASSSARATAWSSSPAPTRAGAGAAAWSIERVRTDDGTELAATDYFRTMGGYLTSHP